MATGVWREADAGGSRSRGARSAACASGLLLVLLIAACGGDSSEPAPQAATVTISAPETVTVTPEPKSPISAGVVGTVAPSNEGTFSMPDEVGKNLQAAQDDLQAVSGNPFFFSGSEDATGAGRAQFLDSGWQVCSQDPAPGTEVRDDADDVLFYVVRNSERCP